MILQGSEPYLGGACQAGKIVVMYSPELSFRVPNPAVCAIRFEVAYLGFGTGWSPLEFRTLKSSDQVPNPRKVTCQVLMILQGSEPYLGRECDQDEDVPVRLSSCVVPNYRLEFRTLRSARFGSKLHI